MSSAALVKIRPASRNTLAESVAEQLITLILEGHFEPGDRLPSHQELAERLQVGRSTVREALGSLATMGLVDVKHGQGTFVRQLNARAILRSDLLAMTIDRNLTEQLVEARQIFEPEIARLAAQRATDEDLAAMREILAKCEAAIAAGQSLHRLSPEFHRTVARGAHNGVLSMAVESIVIPLAERGLLLEEKPGYLEWELASHRRVYDSIAQRDEDGARQAMTQHIEESCAALFEMLP
jgi:GntR family transcriptional repressor for pyruvate dehydrogenase complex